MEIRSVGIVGMGVMGTGIARVAAQAGFPVVLVKWTKGSLDEGRMRFQVAIAKEFERKKLSLETAIEIRERITWSTSADALAGCDLVIESIAEDMESKRDCFRILDAAVKHQSLFATNTSSLDIIDLAIKRPDRFLALHFINPVAKMPLVEVASLAASSETLDAAFSFLKALGKEAVAVGPSPGFVVNRLLMPSLLEAVRLTLWDRRTIGDLASVDACMRLGANHPMGPFQLMDFIGIDVVYAMACNLQEGLRSERFSPPPILERMVDRGWLGAKSGIGFYDHSDPKDPRPNVRLFSLLD